MDPEWKLPLKVITSPLFIGQLPASVSEKSECGLYICVNSKSFNIISAQYKVCDHQKNTPFDGALNPLDTASFLSQSRFVPPALPDCEAEGYLNGTK